MSEWCEDLEVVPTRYDLGPVPDAPKSRGRVSLLKAVGGWVINDGGFNLDRDGDWIEAFFYWSDPQEAIAFYRVWLRVFMENELAAQRAKESENNGK